MMNVRPSGVGVSALPQPKSVATRCGTPARTMSIVRDEMLTSTSAAGGGGLDVLCPQPPGDLGRGALRWHGLAAGEEHFDPEFLLLDDRYRCAVVLVVACQVADRLTRRIGEYSAPRSRAPGPRRPRMRRTRRRRGAARGGVRIRSPVAAPSGRTSSCWRGTGLAWRSAVGVGVDLGVGVAVAVEELGPDSRPGCHRLGLRQDDRQVGRHDGGCADPRDPRNAAAAPGRWCGLRVAGGIGLFGLGRGR